MTLEEALAAAPVQLRDRLPRDGAGYVFIGARSLDTLWVRGHPGHPWTKFDPGEHLLSEIWAPAVNRAEVERREVHLKATLRAAGSEGRRLWREYEQWAEEAYQSTASQVTGIDILSEDQ
jgi:hypothetical protein